LVQNHAGDALLRILTDVIRESRASVIPWKNSRSTGYTALGGSSPGVVFESCDGSNAVACAPVEICRLAIAEDTPEAAAHGNRASKGYRVISPVLTSIFDVLSVYC
jgi:hypothetical protein